MLDCKSIEEPMIQILKLDLTTDKEAYHKLVGKLIYLSHSIRDIVYVVSVMS
jgi:hypothetical protein